MIVGPGTLTAEELEAGAKGFWAPFPHYRDLDDPIWIPASEYAKIVAWCEPYMARRHEVQGAVTFHAGVAELTIERAYVMGGDSISLRSTCKLDEQDMLRQMQADYPDRTQMMADQVGWWHLHPGYFSALSVGDVEECRAVMRASGFQPNERILQLLMYGNGLGYQLTGYLVGLTEVNRLPVRIQE